MYRRFRVSIVVVGIVACMACFSGCSKSSEPTCPVHGVVTLNGKRPKGGVVIFESTVPGSSGRRFSARGVIDPNGQYRLSTFHKDDGAVLGKHRAAILPEEDLNPSSSSPEAVQRRKAIMQIPPQYQSSDTSNLIFDVKPKDNTIDIALQASRDEERRLENCGDSVIH